MYNNIMIFIVNWVLAQNQSCSVPPMVADKGSPLDGELSGYNMENLTIDHGLVEIKN
jgi:hypothetical protein